MKSSESYRTFMITLWKETESYDTIEVLNHIIDLNYDYAYILHDKDDAKPHFHIIIYLGKDTKKTLKTIHKEIGYIPIQDIEIMPILRNALLYLIHYNNDDKHKYSLDEVFGTLKEKLCQYCSITDEGEKIYLFKNYIKEHNKEVNIDNLSDFAYSIGAWSEFRRNYSFLKDLINLYRE